MLLHQRLSFFHLTTYRIFDNPLNGTLKTSVGVTRKLSLSSWPIFRFLCEPRTETFPCIRYCFLKGVQLCSDDFFMVSCQNIPSVLHLCCKHELIPAGVCSAESVHHLLGPPPSTGEISGPSGLKYANRRTEIFD